jgi:hypothetical protein
MLPTDRAINPSHPIHPYGNSRYGGEDISLKKEVI